MQLRKKFPSFKEAWKQYLEFSLPARVMETPFSEEEILQPRGKGRWEADWNALRQPNAGDKQDLEALRQWKRGEMIRLGFVEFATDVSVTDATESLSHLADFCLQKVLELTASQARERLGGMEDSLCVIGLGKLGGGELNYNSDVDILFLYREDADSPSGEAVHWIFEDWARRAVQELQARSPFGQLYRVDLRLRPEGDKGPLARSLDSCENYYAEFGEMWERLALLKTRFCAGCSEVAYDFQRSIQPFCYARDMLPDLLAEIAHLKARAEKEIVGEANQDAHVKLGRGGIRDVEFFVQGQQLLRGARQHSLQHANTLKALQALWHVQLIDRECFETLRDAYVFWRRLENRLQIVNHQQTHSLPREPQALDAIARSLDYENGGQLWEEQMQWRKRVRAIYDEFYGEMQNQPTSSTETALDVSFFRDAPQARRDWDSLAERSTEFHTSKRVLSSFRRLNAHLTQILPSLLRPDLALSQFASFARVYGSRALLYESLASNPNALKLLLKLFDASRYFGETLQACPETFEEAARSGLDDPRQKEQYLAGFRAALKENKHSPLDAARLFKRQESVRIALRWVLELAPWDDLFLELSGLADACLQIGWESIGQPELAVVALGKHGGRELGFGADLDLLFIGGDVDAAQKWARFMTDKTVAGSLFPLDFRLRPYGEGALARSVEEYEQYYHQHAQTWEIQTLCKARFAAGAESLARQWFDAVLPAWKKQAERADLNQEMLAMRRRIEEGRCKSGRPELEFKTGSGGMIDIEFAIQYWQMRRGIFEPRSSALLARMQEEKVQQADGMIEAYALFRKIEAWLRFDLNQSASHLPVERDALDYLARRCGFEGEEAFTQKMAATRRQMREIFNTLLQER
ncbi:MAG: hypothetical protein V1746_03265 [bacterium]